MLWYWNPFEYPFISLKDTPRRATLAPSVINPGYTPGSVFPYKDRDYAIQTTVIGFQSSKNPYAHQNH